MVFTFQINADIHSVLQTVEHLNGAFGERVTFVFGKVYSVKQKRGNDIDNNYGCQCDKESDEGVLFKLSAAFRLPVVFL